MWGGRLIDRFFKHGSRSGQGATAIAKGHTAEEIAAARLTELGYKVIERNFRCKVGEIDLIAWHNEDLVFVEVKSSYASQGIDPVHQVTPAKRRKLIRAALYYMTKRFGAEPNCRFDVVTVKLGDEPIFEVIQNAFDARGRPT
jgi:putative endonuclease